MTYWKKTIFAATAALGLAGFAISASHATEAEIKIVNGTKKLAYLEDSNCGLNCTSSSPWPVIASGIKGSLFGRNYESLVSIGGRYSFDEGGACSFSFNVSEDDRTCTSTVSCSGGRVPVKTSRESCQWGMGEVTYTIN